MPKLVTPAIAWSCLALVVYWFWRLGGSRLGRGLAAVREDELAARAMGVNVSRYRMTAFVTSGAIAGMYGVLIAYFSRFITPDDFGFATAVGGLVTAVVGGSLLFLGPLLGSAFLTSVPEIQRALGVEAGWIRSLLAAALLLVVISLPARRPVQPHSALAVPPRGPRRRAPRAGGSARGWHAGSVAQGAEQGLRRRARRSQCGPRAPQR